MFYLAVAHLTATDLNAPMLEVSSTGEAVDFRPADAASLPFSDGAFDAVVCQFGVMFFKETAYREIHRVLARGGHYLVQRLGLTPAQPIRPNRA